jgi:hypothetical protein
MRGIRLLKLLNYVLGKHLQCFFASVNDSIVIECYFRDTFIAILIFILKSVVSFFLLQPHTNFYDS